MEKPRFSENERVLCYHGPLVYEAKILKVENRPPREETPAGNYYLVHYKGWKSKWDEWVPETRILKLDSEGLAKQRELRIAHSKKRIVVAGPTADEKSERKRHLPNDGSVQQTIGRNMKIIIPDRLKEQLVTEWELVTRSQRLLNLPSAVSVATILEQYKSLKSTQLKPFADSSDLEEFLAGLLDYFDSALGQMLLYRFERYQYFELLRQNPGRPASDIYGIEHLTRLFTKLANVAAEAGLEEEEAEILELQLNDFLKNLASQHDELFDERHYEEATSDYINMSKSV